MMPRTTTHGAKDSRSPGGTGLSTERALPTTEKKTRRGEAHDGTRTCVGCGRRVSAEVRETLIRLVIMRDGGRVEVVADLRRNAGGRGAWVHATWPCLKQAAAKGLARSAKARVQISAEALAEQIGAQAERRVEGLLSSAARAGSLLVGGDAVIDGLRNDPEALVLVAQDARAVATRPEIASAPGRMVWGDKARLGDLTARAEVGVVATTNEGLTQALRRAVSLAATFGATRPTETGGPNEGGDPHQEDALPAGR